MKKIGLVTLFSTLLYGSFFITPVFAANSTNVQISNEGNNSQSNVDVENNTDASTICINGKCTTSGGSDNNMRVCINGKCTDSHDSNVDAHSDDGNDQVHIHSTTSSSPTPTVLPTQKVHEDVTISVIPSISVSPTPNISKMMDQEGKKISQELHDTTKERDSLVQQVVTALSDLFKNLHLF